MRTHANTLCYARSKNALVKYIRKILLNALELVSWEYTVLETQFRTIAIIMLIKTHKYLKLLTFAKARVLSLKTV